MKGNEVMSAVKPLTEAQIAEIKQEFVFFDKDQNGRIDQDEFFELLKVLSPKVKESQANEGFTLIDTNANGAIDFDEFLVWWQNCWWEY